MTRRIDEGAVRWSARLALWLGVVLLAIGAPGPTLAGDDATVLRERAERLWKAQVGDDWGTVHDLLAPEERAMASRADYAVFQKERGPFLYLSATIADAAVEKDLGWVLVEYVWRPRQYPIKPETVKRWQVWSRTEDWHPVPAQMVAAFPTRPPRARPAEEERALAARVEAVWRLQEAGDYAGLFEFLSPEYRGAVSREEFLSRRAQYLYLSHTIEWAEVTNGKGRVKLTLTRKLNDPTLYKLQPETSTTFEDWIEIDGQWFRYLEPPTGSQ